MSNETLSSGSPVVDDQVHGQDADQMGDPRPVEPPAWFVELHSVVEGALVAIGTLAQVTPTGGHIAGAVEDLKKRLADLKARL